MKKYLCCLLALALFSGCDTRMPDKQEIGNSALIEEIHGNNMEEEIKYLSILETYETKEIIDEYPIVNDSTNDYYNWLTNHDVSNEESEHLHLNLEGDFPNQINQFFDEYYKKIEEGGFVAQFIAGWEENFEDILSLTLRYRYFAGGGVGLYKSQSIKIYNIDLNTNQPLTNEELLEKFNLDFEKAQEIIDQQLEKNNIYPCSSGDISHCYFSKENYINADLREGDHPLSVKSNLYKEITEESALFVDGQGNLNMMIRIRNLDISLFDGKPMEYYFIQLN